MVGSKLLNRLVHAWLKDPAHLARIQGRELPPPPLSFTQSAGATGMTSGTFISSDERPSMRHKD